MSSVSRISVCIPTYNNERYLATAIESVLSQTFRDFELIVVDNASIDNTRELVARYVNSDPRVSYFCNSSNLGMVGNWNKCLEYASAEYVKILCSDDVLETECLKRAVEVLERSPEIGLVACSRQVVDVDLKHMYFLGFAERSGAWTGREAIRRSLEKVNPVGEPTATVFRRHLAQRGFNPKVNQLADIEMWLHILQRSDLYYDALPLCLFRTHPGQCTQQNLRNLDVIDESFAILAALDDYLYQNFSKTFIGRVRFINALNIWRLLKVGFTRDVICARVEQYYGLTLFRFLYPFRNLIKRM